MKQMTLCAAMAVVFFAIGDEASAQQPPQPGAEHKELAKVAGKWKAVLKSEYGESTGVATYNSICNGLWVSSDFKMDDGSFTGHGVDGYDPAKKKFISVWFDSMTMTPMTFEGTHDEATKTTTATSEGVGPDGKPAKFKSVTKYTDDDHMTFELFVNSGGTESKMMTIEYTRM